MDALNPRFSVLKGFHIGQVKGNYDTVRLTIELICQISESILTCGVPKFDLHFSLIRSFVLCLNEVDAYCTNVLRLELTLVKSL